MTRIVTANDGTRCRVVRPLEEDERIPADTYVLYKDAFKTDPAFGVSVHMGNHDGPGWLLESLPRIPERSDDRPWGWPAPNPPQYLYDVHAGKLVENPDGTRSMVFPYDKLREGDVVASLGDEGRWCVERLSATRAEHCRDLTAWIDWEYVYGERSVPQGAWLLTHADPTEDV